eukprot:CAMPEP_0194532694 /NCGR_PEP_ID=MMETSP0253-20130528/70320_1 /TAXON_ID=2966 /ORGANISM="Noctiluca scintillans" /LENGTH=88 /DNA_ID=CAMNT_0039378167 /DNA_START=196 /DNA_END=459 /DNA_ORIENTATION=+
MMNLPALPHELHDMWNTIRNPSERVQTGFGKCVRRHRSFNIFTMLLPCVVSRATDRSTSEDVEQISSCAVPGLHQAANKTTPLDAGSQ